eukprot:535453-Rhodomonas_salina.1
MPVGEIETPPNGCKVRHGCPFAAKRARKTVSLHVLEHNSSTRTSWSFRMNDTPIERSYQCHASAVRCRNRSRPGLATMASLHKVPICNRVTNFSPLVTSSSLSSENCPRARSRQKFGYSLIESHCVGTGS